MWKKVGAILCAGLAAFGVASCFNTLKKEKGAIVCDQRYALCTSAQCIPDPTNPEQSLCFCEVRAGKSYGHTTCSKRIPVTDRFGVQHLTSTYSFDDFATKKLMTCSAGSPWSNCLDRPCIVNPLDPTKALCMCQIVRSGSYQTLGGNCDTSTCAGGYWSGASPTSNADAVRSLMKALGMHASPQKLCPLQ